jgi:2-oxoglutarate ferredoxin oxidoreductase subunit beta
MGDGGGYAIGSQHLVNCAFRNEKIMAIVVNNVNYGMTGGQMSPTSLPGQKTETSPYGRDPKETGNPTLGPEMVAAIASPGAYVARASVSNMKQLKRFMKKAVENQIAGNGFSFLEVISSCPTNWRTNAKQTWAFMEEEMAKYFKTGELRTPDESKEG